jgi:protein TorT
MHRCAGFLEHPFTQERAMYTKLRKITLLSAALLSASAASAKDWYPLSIDVSEPPFAADAKVRQMDYTPLLKASAKHRICVSFPHMKDAYWIGVDYGIIDQAKQEGVQIQLLEAGGYTNLSKQLSQIEDCVAAGAEALIVGGISQDALTNTVTNLKQKGIPTIDVINGINAPVAGKALVSWRVLGNMVGQYMAKLHPAGSPPVKIAWLPGPAGAGWVESSNVGFVEALKGSAVQIVDTKYGDTGKEVQAKLVEDMIQAHPDINYIVGTAVTAEAAVPILRARDLGDKIKLVADYYTPGIDQALRTGKILAAPTDKPVIQGRLAVDLAVRTLEGKLEHPHVGPIIEMVDKDNVKALDMSTTLAPASFKPTFSVD